ncbi:MAG: hypothetical protein KJ697_03510 [Nanoarchaeota archaeon]|nr:hypothetical protein [Nanoarchaeota archaeon]MBU4124120.1 hypothetical protein [Nanoarchaeota archaeon]
MALKQIERDRRSDTTNCPRCGGEAVFIDGKIIQWLTCTKCKFKKVVEKAEEKIKVISLKTEEDTKKLFKL